MALLMYAAVLGVLGDRLLVRTPWAARHPRAALRAWHSCAVAFFASIAVALVVIAHDLWEHAVVWLFHAGKPQVHVAYGGVWHVEGIADAALLLLLLASATMGALAARRLVAARREEARVRLLADALGSDGLDGHDGVRVLEHDAPTAFCIPGGRHGSRIVVSRGALGTLTGNELAAAIAHERGHLHLGHHRKILLADVVTAAFGWCGMLRGYAHQVRRLSEMAADDHAAREHGRRAVATALLRMCTVAPGPVGPGALAMAGPDPAERIRRLIAGKAAPAGRLRRAAVACATAALIALPAAFALGPALLVADTAHCTGHCHE
ncbi:M56 family metallopeptidase [Streptomyces sp. IBSNAI002]